ncbi:hypothetical protein Pmani_011654 [Petrolisthes manimaculis]|uniref:Uncharacterized protein n=1 Tax=Petrolisthes manimaculis TaxID=1843537 RepID=A0AAE1UFY8_9EUCA|nr:hypothetical protein Pmani_011654 [Petrolisthes manimaculis]
MDYNYDDTVLEDLSSQVEADMTERDWWIINTFSFFHVHIVPTSGRTTHGGRPSTSLGNSVSPEEELHLLQPQQQTRKGRAIGGVRGSGAAGVSNQIIN